VLNRAKVEAGASMAVFGVGGIGLNCVQGGVLAGAASIIAVDVNAQKLELATRFGATHVIDASREDALAAVRDLTHGGADYTFECVGNLAVIRQALDAVAPAGRSPSWACRASAPPWSWWFTASTTTRASWAAATAPRDRGATSRCWPISIWRAGYASTSLITDRYPLDDFDRALHDLEEGRSRAASSTSARRTEETHMGRYGQHVIDADGHGGDLPNWQDRLPAQFKPSGKSARRASRRTSPTSPAWASR